MRLKKFKNGTYQMTFYHKGIYTKDDKFEIQSPFENDGMDDTDNLHSSNPFIDCNGDGNWMKEIYQVQDITEKNATELDDEYVVMTEEELKDKRDRSLKSSVNRSKRMIYDYGRSNVWEWFFTFTFEPVEHFDRDNYEECRAKVCEWFRNVRRRCCKEIKYLIVPEQHKSGAWHFHALVSNCDGLTFIKAKNQQRWLKIDGDYVYDKKGQPVPNKYFGDFLRTSYPDGDFIYNIKEFQSGFTTATRIVDTKKAVSYIVKYITKDLCECTFGKRRYLPSNNLELPELAYFTCDGKKLQNVLQYIEYRFCTKLSIDCIKTYKVDVENYSNTISVFEFGSEEKDVQNLPDFQQACKEMFLYV